MLKKRHLIVLFLLVLIFSCKGRDTNKRSNNEEVPFLKHGVFNITDNLSIRNAPSPDSEIIREAPYGIHFSIFETSGSGLMENGVLDLWYKISPTEDEWVNALFLRKFPFFISTNERLGDRNRLRITIMCIEGYREIDGRRELQINVQSMGIYQGMYLTPLNFQGTAGLMKDFLFAPNKEYVIQNYSSNILSEYPITLIDNNFNILRDYSLEMEKIGDLYNSFIESNPDEDEPDNLDGNMVFFNKDDVYFHEFFEDYTWTTIITVYSPDINLPGIKIGSKRDDIFAYFGQYGYSKTSSSHRTHYVEDPDYLEYYIISQTITHEEITFYLGYYFNSHFFTNEIIFYLTDDEVVRITDSKKNEK